MLRRATEHIGYPVLPVVQQLTNKCIDGLGQDGLGQWCHWGATTQDITDTATVLQTGASLDLIGVALDRIGDALAKLARAHRDTPMIERSNLQQAIPVTLGYKAAVWLSGIDRHRERLRQVRPRVMTGEFGGPWARLRRWGTTDWRCSKACAGRLACPSP